jgi:hypothetical protein
MADKNDVASRLYLAFGLTMHFGNERAGGVKIGKAPIFGIDRNRFGNAMRGKHHMGTGGHLVQLVDENGPSCPQAVDHEFVVHDFVPHIDRRAMALQRLLDDLDRAVHACAESRAGRPADMCKTSGRDFRFVQSSCNVI